MLLLLSRANLTTKLAYSHAHPTLPPAQVGAFPHYGGRWAEWNGKFRDTVRQFIKGTDGPWAGEFASALCGSPDVYGRHQPAEEDWWGNHGGRQWRGNRGPAHSVNFICAHDGACPNG